MEFQDEFVFHLTGGNSIAFHLAAFFFMLFGALITVLYDFQTRSTNANDNPDTPKDWSWAYFWRENRWRIALDLLMAMVVIRFFTDFTGKPLSMGYCFLIGVVFDAMLVIYRKLRKRIMSIFENINFNT